MSGTPLMPKATAVWLVENTALTFEQIANFCKLHTLEVKAIADGEAAHGIKGQDPVQTGQLTRAEIEKCEKAPSLHLSMAVPKTRVPEAKRRVPRYTPVSRRQDRPNAILWLVKNHPELKDQQVMRLVGTTKTTIAAIRDRTHWNISQLTPNDPVTLGLCSQLELDMEVEKSARYAPAPEREAVTLIPVEETTSHEAISAFLTSGPRKPVEEEEEIDADAVFAKLNAMKAPKPEDGE